MSLSAAEIRLFVSWSAFTKILSL